MHFVSKTCEGERCGLCANGASHKVGEEIAPDDPFQARHNFTTYVCCRCFRYIMGPAAFCPHETPPSPSG